MNDEITVIGLGNILWADEGFGVRVAEKLSTIYSCRNDITIIDGGTQGLALLPWLKGRKKVMILDAIDFNMAPGDLAVFWNNDVPVYLSAKKMSLHQTGFSEVLSLSELMGDMPEEIVLIGVQPECIEDYGGSLSETVRKKLNDAVGIAMDILHHWGISSSENSAGERINHESLELEKYEQGRPDEYMAFRGGDIRVLMQDN